MIREIKTFEIVCDRCKKSIIMHGQYASVPKNWNYFETYDCGLTGYTRRDLLCPDCQEKKNEN